MPDFCYKQLQQIKPAPVVAADYLSTEKAPQTYGRFVFPGFFSTSLRVATSQVFFWIAIVFEIVGAIILYNGYKSLFIAVAVLIGIAVDLLFVFISLSGSAYLCLRSNQRLMWHADPVQRNRVDKKEKFYHILRVLSSCIILGVGALKVWYYFGTWEYNHNFTVIDVGIILIYAATAAIHIFFSKKYMTHVIFIGKLNRGGGQVPIASQIYIYTGARIDAIITSYNMNNNPNNPVTGAIIIERLRQYFSNQKIIEVEAQKLLSPPFFRHKLSIGIDAQNNHQLEFNIYGLLEDSEAYELCVARIADVFLSEYIGFICLHIQGQQMGGQI